MPPGPHVVVHRVVPSLRVLDLVYLEDTLVVVGHEFLRTDDSNVYLEFPISFFGKVGQYFGIILQNGEFILYNSFLEVSIRCKTLVPSDAKNPRDRKIVSNEAGTIIGFHVGTAQFTFYSVNHKSNSLDLYSVVYLSSDSPKNVLLERDSSSSSESSLESLKTSIYHLQVINHGLFSKIEVCKICKDEFPELGCSLPLSFRVLAVLKVGPQHILLIALGAAYLVSLRDILCGETLKPCYSFDGFNIASRPISVVTGAESRVFFLGISDIVELTVSYSGQSSVKETRKFLCKDVVNFNQVEHIAVHIGDTTFVNLVHQDNTQVTRLVVRDSVEALPKCPCLENHLSARDFLVDERDSSRLVCFGDSVNIVQRGIEAEAVHLSDISPKGLLRLVGVPSLNLVFIVYLYGTLVLEVLHDESESDCLTEFKQVESLTRLGEPMHETLAANVIDDSLVLVHRNGVDFRSTTAPFELYASFKEDIAHGYVGDQCLVVLASMKVLLVSYDGLSINCTDRNFEGIVYSIGCAGVPVLITDTASDGCVSVEDYPTLMSSYAKADKETFIGFIDGTFLIGSTEQVYKLGDGPVQIHLDPFDRPYFHGGGGLFTLVDGEPVAVLMDAPRRGPTCSNVQDICQLAPGADQTRTNLLVAFEDSFILVNLSRSACGPLIQVRSVLDSADVRDVVFIETLRAWAVVTSTGLRFVDSKYRSELQVNSNLDFGDTFVSARLAVWKFSFNGQTYQHLVLGHCNKQSGKAYICTISVERRGRVVTIQRRYGTRLSQFGEVRGFAFASSNAFWVLQSQGLTEFTLFEKDGSAQSSLKFFDLNILNLPESYLSVETSLTAIQADGTRLFVGTTCGVYFLDSTRPELGFENTDNLINTMRSCSDVLIAEYEDAPLYIYAFGSVVAFSRFGEVEEPFCRAELSKNVVRMRILERTKDTLRVACLTCTSAVVIVAVSPGRKTVLFPYIH